MGTAEEKEEEICGPSPKQTLLQTLKHCDLL